MNTPSPPDVAPGATNKLNLWDDSDMNERISLRKLCKLEHVWIAGLTDYEKTKYFNKVMAQRKKAKKDPEELIEAAEQLYTRLKSKAPVFKYLESFSPWEIRPDRGEGAWLQNIDTGETQNIS
jgi:hypothetical protein